MFEAQDYNIINSCNCLITNSSIYVVQNKFLKLISRNNVDNNKENEIKPRNYHINCEYYPVKSL